ncbi:signal transduction protein [Novosphingobium sp. FSY-8]|uniref:Signal transduction protein n=1 Tax=Novosphingobium ovatum TaxID=1908523 RepID=A0ABW9XCA4_9SPHN|nr:EF-hand domain-containing protein [Novosphingobium ovatum]NBC36160.1 signal transduction protein [Novosphingobium ovatum]
MLHRFLPALTLALGVSCAMPIAHAQPALRNGDAQQVLDRLMEADTNGDGQVTRVELIARRGQQFERLDRNQDGHSTLDEIPALFRGRFEPAFQLLLREFDANHDGKISRAEFINGPTRGFDLADANHDGIVTRAEVEAASARIRTAAKAGAGGRP